MLNPLIAGEPSKADVLEGTTPKYTATLTDDDGNPLPAASLTTLVLTYYLILADGSIGYINDREQQDVLNTNDVTVDSNGLITWEIQPEDTEIFEDVPFERHVALWEWTWNSGAKVGRHELLLTIKNLETTPVP